MSISGGGDESDESTAMAKPTPVSIDRVITMLGRRGIELQTDATSRAAQGSVHGCGLLLVLLDSVLIVRIDSPTDVRSDSSDATLYYAANKVNSAQVEARALVVNRTENLTLRAEAEIPVAAGMTDEQLSTCTHAAVKAVVACQRALQDLVDTLG